MSDAKSQFSEAVWKKLRKRLGAWYAEAKRPLPWRTDVSLYRTVVSEFMCQQTKIDTALPYFARWMNRFPDFSALAEAGEEAVLTAWSGLGYYARARNLHRLSKALSSLDPIPETPAEWKKLPGIGPYTAAAICSIVFRHPAAVVDGNVIRVLARLAGVETIFPSNQAAAKAIQPLADAFLDRLDPGEHNQALMELGAFVCSKHRPACLLCPLKAHCRSANSEQAAGLPRIERRKTEKVVVNRLWYTRGGKILLHRQHRDGKRLASFAELPLWPTSIPLEDGVLIATRHRGISHQRIEERIFAAPEGFPDNIEPDCFLHPHTELEKIPISGPHRRWIFDLNSISR